MIKTEVDKPKVTKTVVVYSGRFQPFHNGHYATYKHLVDKFGSDSVYIGTSNDTSSPKSPFNFQEKKKISTTMFPIPANKFILIKNPYQPKEILSKFDGKTTQYVAVVGEKDADRLSGKYFKPYKDKQGYGYDEIGYVYAAPAQPNPISGTDVRNNLGGADKEKAKEFFSKRAYPKFNQKIFDFITKRLSNISEDINVDVNVGDEVLMGKFKNKKIKVKDIGNDSHGMPTINGRQATTFRKTEEGFPGGIGVGLNLPNGYINGAPTGSVVEMYDPIKQIVQNLISESDFEDFLENYLGEKTNPVLDKEIEYTSAKGDKKKITVRGALRLPKEHPAHVEAKKLTAKEKPTETPSAGETPFGAKQKIDRELPKEKEAEKEQPQEEPAGKLEPKDFKASAETSSKVDTEKTETQMKLDDAMKGMHPDEQKVVKDINDPKSSTRQGILQNLKNGLNNFGKGIVEWSNHKRGMLDGCGKGLNNLMHGRKLGSLEVPEGIEIKDTKGKTKKYASFRDLQSTDDKGQPEYEDVTTTDNKGQTKTEKKPKAREGLNEKELEFFNNSYKRYKHEKHGLTHTAKDVGLLVGSMMLGGAGLAAGKAALAGQGLSGIASATAQGAVGVFTHGIGGFSGHLAKDIAKHATLETLGLGATRAATHGAGLSIATGGLLEYISENIDSQTLTKNILNAVTNKIENFKLSDEQLLKSIESYKEKKPKEDIAKLLKPNDSDDSQNEHYVSATGMFNRKLSPQQKIDKLNPARVIEKSKIWHKTFSHHDSETGEITETKIKNIANFVEYATKRLKLNQKPKVKLITGNSYPESQGSLGGYSDQTKEIYVAVEGRLTADILRTLAHEMAHRKQDEMGLIRSAEEDGKTGSPIENKAHIVAGILMREYGKINKTIFQEGYLQEASSIVGSANDDQPDGMFLPKGKERKLGQGNGVNKSDEWFMNGGYIQIDFPKADAIFGDEDADAPYVIWKVKNLPRTDFEKTKFNKKNFVKEGNVYGTDNGESFRSPYSPDWKSHDKYGEKHAEIIGYKVAKHNSEIDAKKASKYIPVQNPNEENGPGKRSIHPSKGAEYYKEKTERWEMYPFNSRPDPYSYPDVWAKPKPVAPIKSLSETFDHRVVSLLTEGGAYGHMAHPFDDMQLTFGDLKNIISGALDGRLELTREKTDGQALAISWKNGRLIAARNKGHLANAGANAMGIEDVATKFAGRGGLSDAYNFAMKDLSAAIAGLSNAQKEKIFKNGQCFMNLEVIWPESVNVIPYGQALLVFHNITCYDDSGTAISGDVEPARILGGMIKQINANVQSKYSIQGPAITTLPKSSELSKKKGKYFTKLNKLQNQFGCNDNDTMAVHHQYWWENFINTKAPIQPDKLTLNALVRRWAFGDKSFKLNTISNPELQKWAIENDKVNVEKQQRDNIRPFEEIFLGVGSDVLQFVTSVLTVHPNKAIRNMKDRLQATAEKVKQSNDPKIINKFKNELERLNKLGGVDKIVAAEGIVFVYNGKTYKLTGTFAPLNQLLGIFYG